MADPTDLRGRWACRHCRHDQYTHNVIQGCESCPCLATPMEAAPRNDAELDAPILPTDQRLPRYEGKRAVADPTDVTLPAPRTEGVPWLNPRDLPGGVQVRHWAFDDDGPAELPVALETPGTHTDLTAEQAARIGRALLGAAGRAGVADDARDRLAKYLCLRAVGPKWAGKIAASWVNGSIDTSPWYAEADALLNVIIGKDT